MKRDANVTAAVQQGREAFERRAWAEAYAQLSAAHGATSLGVDDLERLAIAAYLVGSDEISDDLWARAHNEHLRLNNVPRAVRCTFRLAFDLLTRGEMARASGWLARAQHLLDDGDHDCPERGLLLVLRARLDVKRGDAHSAAAIARDAVEIARRFDDRELEVFARMGFAQALMKTNRIDEAAALFDELMVAVTVDDVSPITVGVVYCAVIDACHQIADIERGRAWTNALSRWCESQPDLVPFRGQCLVHRAEIMRLSGAWSKAMEEAEQACRLLSQAAARLNASTSDGDMPSFKYPVGAAFYELAEIHRMRGHFAEAAEAYEQASRYGHSPEPGVALLRLAQGRLNAADAAIRRVLVQRQHRLARATTLAACVEIMIAADDRLAARSAADELTRIADESGTPFLRALSAHWMGAVLRAEGDARAALTALRTAWMTWQEIDAPYEAARVRVLLGLVCRDLGDEDGAALELDAAHRVFHRLSATPDFDRVTELVGSMAHDTRTALTAREVQVIGLIATGKTNRAIAKQLSISARTVDRHVSNILMKLELPSRSAATAYAYEHDLV